jgi:hypothetical protein
MLLVWRSVIVGGSVHGKPGTGEGNGGAGVRATRSRVELFGGPGSTVAGGDGQEVIFGSGIGAPGVDLHVDSMAHIQQSIPITGGVDGDGVGQAPPIVADASSSFTFDARVLPTLASSTQQVQLGTSLALTLTGNPGGFQVLFLSLHTGPTKTFRGVDGFGMLVLDRTQLFTLAGVTLPASGAQAVNVRVPNLSSLLGSTLFFQSAEEFGGSFAIANPALVTITH